MRTLVLAALFTGALPRGASPAAPPLDGEMRTVPFTAPLDGCVWFAEEPTGRLYRRSHAG